MIITRDSALVPRPPGAYLVTDFGPFISGVTSQVVKAQNKRTINSALDSIGRSGGGVLYVPSGRYYFPAGGHAITIRYSNMTLQGAGMYQTAFCTNGTWDTVTKSRSPGILIQGTDDARHPQENVALRDFELDGQSGWTGEYRWWTPEERRNGWDITHHGIDVAIDHCLNNILLENLYVHRFKGELLYTGGMRVGKLTLRNVRSEDTNASTFNLYGADALIENCSFGGPSRFWIEVCARANEMNYPVNRMVFRHCYFRDAKGDNSAIAIAQGNGKSYAYRFEDCTFDGTGGSGYGLFVFCGGVAGPVTVRHNEMINCDGTNKKGMGAVIDFEWGGGSVDSSKLNQNITFESNTIYSKGGPIIDMSGSWIGKAGPEVIKNFKFTHNLVYGDSLNALHGSPSMIYGARVSWDNHELTEVEMENVRISDNKFIHCIPPKRVGAVLGSQPKFESNEFISR